MRAILVTSCTSRKKRTPSPLLRARNLRPDLLLSVVSEWVSRVRDAADRTKARDLYAGRSFTEALASECELFVCSAGLGLIGSDAPVPPYSLTVTGSDPDNVLLRIQDPHVVRASQWWNALISKLGTDSLSGLIAGNPGRLIVLALPAAYLRMVSDDLDSLSNQALQRLRIVARAGATEGLSDRVAESTVTYDDRLEGAGGGIAGTRSDFTQRAARHFVGTILPKAPGGNAKEHNGLISRSLVGYSPRVIEQRPRHSDDELIRIIRGVWREAGGRVTAGLRILRRERHVACEQSRFKKLFAHVSEEMKNAKT